MTWDLNRELFVAEFPDSGYTSRLGSRTLFMQTAVIGTAYVAVEWFTLGEVRDTTFVSMIVGATALLSLGMRGVALYLSDHALDYFRLVEEEARATLGGYQELVRSLFDPRSMTLSGCVYGLLVGTAPVLTNAWPDRPVLQGALCVLLFSVNFPTGVAFYGLVRFIIRARKMSKFAPVSLWHIEDPATEFLLTTTRRIVLLAAVYIAICISSVLFSMIPLQELVIAYSVFSAGVILVTYFAPILPFVIRMRREKRHARQRVSRQLHEEFQKVVHEASDDQSGVGPAELENTQTLMDLRKEIASAPIWPFRSQILTTVLYVLSVSSLPAVLQAMLENFLPS